MNLYKGYVPTKDKKSTMPFKGKTSKDLMTLEQVQDLPEYAGVLNDNTILIDVDILHKYRLAADHLHTQTKALHYQCS